MRILQLCIRACALVLLIAAFGAVYAQEGGGHGGGDGHGGMMMSGLPAVGPEVTIRFAAAVGGSPAACGMIYDGVGAAQSTISLNDFRFYISNIRLITRMGEEVPVELTQDGRWQYADVVLLDFEDGTGTCREVGTPDMNDKAIGTVPAGEYTGLVFDLGVPFDLNHLDTTTAPAPLNLPAMWWNWRFGYKFVRIDMQTPQSQTPAWFIHLGSTGCPSPDSSTPPTEPCSNPNLSTVRLEGFSPTRNFVIADAAALLSGVNLNESTPMPPGCMSGADDPDCIGLFPAFGLDLESGTLSETGSQLFFRAG